MVVIPVLALAVALSGSRQSPSPAPPDGHVPAAAPEGAGAFTVLQRDTRGRPVISTLLNDQGPFPMVVDTAAQMSLVTLPLAGELGLPALDGAMTLNGASGVDQARLYGVERFSSDLFDVEGVALLALPNAAVTEARGIIGMELFIGRKLVFDPGAQRLTLSASSAPGQGYVAVKGRLDGAGLLMVPVEIDGVAFEALVDTGAGPTVASNEGLGALGWTDADPRLRTAGGIRGATRQGAAARAGRVGRIRLGPVNFRDINLIFADIGPARPGPAGEG